MVNMAETESVFLGAGAAAAGAGGRLVGLNGATSEDSETELEAPVLQLSSRPRNKRKNFRPRNIYYSEGEGEDGAPLALCRRWDGDEDEEDDEEEEEEEDELEEEEEEGALDLSGAEPERKKVRLTAGPQMGKISGTRFGHREEEMEEDDDLDEEYVDEDDDDDDGESGGGSVQGGGGYEEEALDLSGKPRQRILFHLGPGPPEASDLREYAQNTVKELLEIYGLNSAEVAESINNVPIANFTSGKILDSVRGAVSVRGVAVGPGPGGTKSEPPTPPRTPSSAASTPHSAPPSASPITMLTVPVPPHRPLLLSAHHHHPPPPPLPPKEPPQPTKAVAPVNNFNPPRMFPQNMASILALATAMQERGSQVPSTSSPQRSANSPLLLGAQASGIAAVPPRETKVVTPLDYSRYVRRFTSSLECGSQYCKELNYREHFHCLDCNSRVFVKKEEMIRHFKWHKKRDESLQHGFMRYSPSDDCSDRYPHCGHNRKQTHYHCIQGTCDKVYISTSDVQMHANYHRKDSAIIQEGFQRLRATEECRTPYCAFFGQRTTHFHCRRDHCQFTFKNKADMEKHKTYHIKDEQLARDGFKKFLKPDPCGFPNCRFSQVCNHIHCVRDGCSYVLHSSGQLLSHKRKHERKDSEIAYRKFKLAQQAVVNIASTNTEPSHGELPAGTSLQLLQQASSLAALTALHDGFSNSSTESRASPKLLHTPPQFKLHPGESPSFMDQSGSSTEPIDDDITRYILTCNQNQSCSHSTSCPLSGSEHYHCKESVCEMSFRCRETAEGHARMHEAQERVSDFYQESSHQCQESCPREKHFHCTWDGCTETVMPSERLEHFRSHEISAQHNNSLESLFRRKRGRPPKNRVIEVWNDYATGSTSDSPQAIFTSFKLPKPTVVSGILTQTEGLPISNSPVSTAQQTDLKPLPQLMEVHGFQSYNEGCPDPLCSLSIKPHYHCSRPRCFFATDNEEFLFVHVRDFHDNVEILEGFLFFDRSVDCRMENCPNNKVSRHFHCVIPGCGYSFVRYSNMAIHQAKHKAEKLGIPLSPSSQPTDLSENSDKEPIIKQEVPSKINETISEEHENNNPSKPTVVKASGTFYPLCGLSNSNTSPTPPSEVSIKVEPGITSNEASLPEWMSMDKHERYGPEVTCSRPFCKLKRKEHYHCNLCNQAFSELDKLKPHIAKHSPGTLSQTGIKSENNNNEENNQPQPLPAGISMLPLNLDGQEMLPPPHFHGFSAAMAAAVANQQLAMITSQGIPFMPHTMPGLYTSPSGLMFATPPGFGPHPSAMVNTNLLESARVSILGSDPSSDSVLTRRPMSPQRDMSIDAKKARVQTSMRMLKDEPVPEGYLRFRFNEDCRYTHCGYREHQTHFHCMRQDCGYSFCDKTRFVQHTARHERLDTLMGGDFQQYRANVSCGRPDCSYTSTLGAVQNKASHFHCLKCDFVCTDTNKVVAHRRQHQKLDSIMAAGFEKFTPSQPCSTSETCVHSGKQTHYHCLSCQYAVLGLSQMTAHKYRHME